MASKVNVDELKRYYRQMWLIRRFEEESARAYAQGKIGGFLHLYIGQEAIAVGGAAALTPDDYVITTYRDHGHALALGMSSRAAMAELFGKKTGCSKGLGGSMHMFDLEHHFLGGHGIVGGHLALASGVAFKLKYNGEKGVCLGYCGEGATNIGGFHEALSLAAIWKLPAVFIVENNEYSMGTPLDRTLPVRDITTRAAGYGMYSDRFEANDVFEVREKLKKAVDHARSGKGPALIEILTYRFRGHSMSDPGKYRTPEEVELRKKKDPVRVARQLLTDNKIDAKELDAIDADAEQEVQDAVQHADESGYLSEEEMMELVYAPSPDELFADQKKARAIGGNIVGGP
ncbi:MAG TPA: pyruvate dehydrogenase (acetyl-transferring) E1 component subunit alpha [Polyangiales bacterium]|nr:pyruvate dehydrogenase (acetyl-transferring) E1 component subunit alpha [Polyangiales bacterium]